MDANAERTITVIGDRLGPHGDDPLPWADLDGVDAVYLTAGDPGAVRMARAARKLVSTVRAMDALAGAGVQLDALVSSAKDEGERYTPGYIHPPPLLVVRTAGAAGGSLVAADGRRQPVDGGPVARSPGGRLRRGRLLRRRPDLRAGRGTFTQGGADAGGPLWGGVHYGTWTL